MTFGCHKDFAMSIDRINNSKGYTMDNIQLVCREVNVQGKENTCGQPTNIDYIRIFMSLINFVCYDVMQLTNANVFEKNLQNTPIQNGVKASRRGNYLLYQKQCRNLHLRHILSEMCHDATKKDIKKKRIGSLIMINDMLHILRKHEFRCYYSKMPLEMSQYSKYRLSFERLDNRKSHGESGNCVPIIRILNCTDNSARKDAKGTLEDDGRGMSESKLLRMILDTNLIMLTEVERTKLEAHLWFLNLGD